MGYKLSVKASNDIENIWLYTFEKWSLEQADRYINLIIDEIEYLSYNPNSGKISATFGKTIVALK